MPWLPSVKVSCRAALALSFGVGLLAGMAACTTTEEPRHAEQIPLYIGVYETNSRHRRAYFPVQEHADDSEPVYVSPGQYTVSVMVEWSNRHVEAHTLAFDAQPGSLYWIGAYEVGEGQELAQAVARVPTFADEMLGAGREGAVAGAWPLLLIVYPFRLLGEYLFSSETAPPLAPPYEGCCFVWVEEIRSGKFVSGEAPASIEASRRKVR